MNTSLDPRRSASLERVVQEFGNLMIKFTSQPSAYVDNFVEREVLLVQQETTLYAAEGCVNVMRGIWPSGNDIYDRLLLGIAELRKQRALVEEFFNVVSSDIPTSQLRAKHREIMTKNRERIMYAYTYMSEAAEILYEKTGIELNIE